MVLDGRHVGPKCAKTVPPQSLGALHRKTLNSCETLQLLLNTLLGLGCYDLGPFGFGALRLGAFRVRALRLRTRPFQQGPLST